MPKPRLGAPSGCALKARGLIQRLPQLAETKAPQAVDVPAEPILYDEFMIRRRQRDRQVRALAEVGDT